MGWIFAFSGAAAGAAQAGLLGRSVRRAPSPFGLLLRLGLVGVVLLLAALAGRLVWGAAGWIAGFGVAALVVYRRLR